MPIKHLSAKLILVGKACSCPLLDGLAGLLLLTSLLTTLIHASFPNISSITSHKHAHRILPCHSSQYDRHSQRGRQPVSPVLEAHPSSRRCRSGLGILPVQSQQRSQCFPIDGMARLALERPDGWCTISRLRRLHERMEISRQCNLFRFTPSQQ
jgi:hypothetical protein